MKKIRKILKKISMLLLTGAACQLAFRQYKFNMQVEYYSQQQANFVWCEHWDHNIPTMAKAQVALGEVSKKEYKEWMGRIEEDKRTSCEEQYEFIVFNPEMPWTDKWHEFRKASGLTSLTGYMKDLTQEPYKASGRHFTEFKPTVLVKKHWYEGGPGKCVVEESKLISGSPLPLLSRRLYVLSCKNDVTEQSGLGGFIVVTTSDFMEKL